MIIERKILVVEDSLVVSKVLQHLLSQSPTFTPVLCVCYKEAEASLKSDGNDFFAAIVDLDLPDAENGEVVDLVLSYKIPCVVLTGSVDDSLRLDLLNKGVLDYITKESSYSFDLAIKVIERLGKNQGIKVLVAEDSSTSRLFIKILLERYRFKVVEAINGQEALAKLESDPEIRMLITDHNMPLVNGYDLVRMLRYNVRFQNLVIIGLSAEGDSTLSAKFIKAGANDFLKKPFYHEEFHCRVIRNLEAQEMLEMIKGSVNVDPLTKLKNRLYLFNEGERFFRENSPNVSLAMISVDGFKQINDRYGYIIGDRLLEAVGAEVRSSFDGLLVCRFGGEEFCVVANMEGQGLHSLLNAFLLKLRSKELTEAKHLVTCSAGICSLTVGSLEESIRAADYNLGEAKRLGRDQIVSDM